MCEQEPVYESTASYYEEASKTWKTGEFRLYENCILFSSDEKQVVKIPLKNISALEKRQSSIIYAALVICVGAEKHWFASFPNRDSLYNLIELFWRDALFSKNHVAIPDKPKPASSDLGKELLNILHESEVTLINAANALSDQGQQIEETQATITDINSDLNVAEKFLERMSSFPPLFQRPSTSVADNDETDIVKSFKVSYLLSDTITDSSFWDKGVLFIDKADVALLNDKKTQDITIPQNDIIACKMISTWKLCLKYKEGNIEKSLYVMCPKMTKLLKYLKASSVKDKFPTNNLDIPTASLFNCLTPSTSSSRNAFLSSANIKDDNSPKQNSEQLQEDMISDADIQEISNMLNSLQTLASEVSREQQDQLEKINALMTNTETTELRMKVDTKKIKKLV